MDIPQFLMQAFDEFGDAVQAAEIMPTLDFEAAASGKLLQPLEQQALKVAVDAFCAWLAIKAAGETVRQAIAAKEQN